MLIYILCSRLKMYIMGIFSHFYACSSCFDSDSESVGIGFVGMGSYANYYNVLEEKLFPIIFNEYIFYLPFQLFGKFLDYYYSKVAPCTLQCMTSKFSSKRVY